VSQKKNLCVTFDLWETLLLDQPELDLARGRLRCKGIQRAVSNAGIELSLTEIERGYAESAHQLLAIWKRNEHLSTLEQVQLILKLASGRNITLPKEPEILERVLRGYVDPLFEVPPRLNRDAKSTLEGMRERVKGIGLISNTGRSPGPALRRLIDDLGILKFFDRTTFSDEIRCRKPDQRIFLDTAKGLGVAPTNTIHIGDDLEADIWGAKRAGMRAFLFDYDVPQGFKRRPDSLFALSRSDRSIPDSEINPDARIKSLNESLKLLDSLSQARHLSRV
jgi:HAD superfamily hydrolase (TIGR01509 family)